MGEVLDQRPSLTRIDRCEAHPCIAGGFFGPEPDHVRGQCSVASNTEIGGWNNGQSRCTGGLVQQFWRHPPARLKFPDPAHPVFSTEFIHPRRAVIRQTDEPALVVDHVKNGQVVLLDKGVEQVSIGSVELDENHACVRRIVEARERRGDLWTIAQKGVERPGCQTKNTA